MKISFHAFMKNETLLELWLKTIERSFKFLLASRQLPLDHQPLRTQMLQTLDFKQLMTLKNIVKI